MCSSTILPYAKNGLVILQYMKKLYTQSVGFTAKFSLFKTNMFDAVKERMLRVVVFIFTRDGDQSDGTHR